MINFLKKRWSNERQFRIDTINALIHTLKKISFFNQHPPNNFFSNILDFLNLFFKLMSLNFLVKKLD